jgi:hypothetical protein
MKSTPIILCAMLLVSLWACPGQADPMLVAHHQGVQLADMTDYDWWYGCSPTSAGMMLGYYDRSGYDGLLYDDLVAGGVAEASNYGNPSARANGAIASAGHIADFWTGYGNSGDDPLASGHSFNSLADFMGTSQDAVGNSDGGTTFWNYDDGARLYASQLAASGTYYIERSGMIGIGEYIEYCGYGLAEGDFSLDYSGNLFNQYVDALGLTYGFSLADYIAEINAGRTVMIHVDGHSMVGYGYDDQDPTQILIRDTWTAGLHTMTWGGYYSGMIHYGVTAMEIAGGAVVPLPSAVLLAAMGMGTYVVGRVRRKKMAA